MPVLLLSLALLVPADCTVPAPGEFLAVVQTHPRVYEVQISFPGNQLSGTLTVDLDATPPAVTLQIGDHEAAIMSARRSADSLGLVTSHEGNLFEYKLVLDGEKIRGTVTRNGGELKGTVTGQRQR